jgi:hypothetical protein
LNDREKLLNGLTIASRKVIIDVIDTCVDNDVKVNPPGKDELFRVTDIILNEKIKERLER